MTKSEDAPEKGGVPRADAGPSGGLMDRSKGRDGASPGTKESTCNAGDAGGVGSIPALGKSPREGNGNPLQYSCLENPWAEELGRLQSMGSQESDTT